MKYSSSSAIRSSSSAISSLGLSPVSANTSSATFLISLARGSYDLYTRWPNPISRPRPAFTSSMNRGMFFFSPISSSICSTASLAPPCNGPYNAAIPAETAENGSTWDDPTARTALVEQFCS